MKLIITKWCCALAGTILFLSACNPPPEIEVQGTIFNLDGTIELSNNDTDILSINGIGDQEFAFPVKIPVGGAYDVAVYANPIDQVCVISNGTGIVENEGSLQIEVHCTTTPTPRPLNDTGVVHCGDYSFGVGGSGNSQNYLDCGEVGAGQTVAGVDVDGDPVPAGQDALYGRDYTQNDDQDGFAGFSFTKLGADGQPTRNWFATCVKDNVTRLMWEIKTVDGGLHDKDWQFTWYTSAGNDGGRPGDVGEEGPGCYLGTICNTEQFAALVNEQTLCGYNDWRLPTAEELGSIINMDINQTEPAIDISHFPRTMVAEYWTSDTMSVNLSSAWIVDFRGGWVLPSNKSSLNHIRLVRSGD